MRENRPTTVHLKDYRAPDYLVERVELHFELLDAGTTVTARLDVRRNPLHAAEGAAPLVLDGVGLELLEISLDDEELEAGSWQVEEERLVVHSVPERFSLETVSRVHPENNTSLEGLYRSGSMYCTQCEAQGFRKITWFVDRPDVLSAFRTTIVADRERYPVLLSNGNDVASGELEDGRHWVTWENPFPMPCYLFALVAGNLEHVADTFRTASGREVALRIYTEAENIGRVDHAMDSLQRAMRWDEDVYGREYDLDIFMIVAVNDFNMGAMENKGLNIFNSSCVLADPQTATDAAFQRVEGIIAHEYFHNWSGNRVTCRDWFQLSLKEGFTVFRDQSFSADMGSATVKRIDDVSFLRTVQFAEDAGPLAHPVRPDSYIEISNFYTTTVYEKGAEVVRMLHTLLGAERFRAGTDLYFERHDGQAVTCDDFVQALEDASGVDLARFRRWYRQAGTPVVHAGGRWDPEQGTWTLDLRQELPRLPGQDAPEPLVIPLRIGLLGPDGNDLPLDCGQLSGENHDVLEFGETEASFTFRGLDAEPVPSLLRGFSAPVRLEYSHTPARLRFLIQHDSDGFNRWEAAQRLMQRSLERATRIVAEGGEPRLGRHLETALEAVLRDTTDPRQDHAMLARLLTLPSEAWLGEQGETVDPVAIHHGREALVACIARRFRSELFASYHLLRGNLPWRFTPEECARRSLLNVCLGYLMARPDPQALSLCREQYANADNMTEVGAALRALVQSEYTDAADQALEDFHARWRHDPLMVDQWFSIQAACTRPGALDRVERLLEHPDFDYRNPNKLRSVIGVFANQNLVNFHAEDGSGYRFLAAHVLRLDALNPQVASRLLVPLTRWRRYGTARGEQMRGAIDSILASGKLSKDVYEIAAKAVKPD